MRAAAGEGLRQIRLARTRRTFNKDRFLHLGREPDDLHQNRIRRVPSFAESSGDVFWRAEVHYSREYGQLSSVPINLLKLGIFLSRSHARDNRQGPTVAGTSGKDFGPDSRDIRHNREARDIGLELQSEESGKRMSRA